MDETFIFAEIGINHNGNLALAKKLIDGAYLAGCDAVKFQKRTIDTVYSKKELDVYRESPWGTTNREHKNCLEFGKEEYDLINNYSKQKPIDWTTSVWDLDSLEFMQQYDVPFLEIPSALITNNELVRETAKTKIPMIIISTLEVEIK